MTATSVADSTRTLTVAIIGNPNTGKSTLFNALSGLQSRIGNFPGVTVEKKIGRIRGEGRTINLVDLPGTYSLSPRTLDEMVSVDVLLGRQKDVGPLDAVVCIVDASNLERNLYLVSQILDIDLPTVLVLNMGDVAAARGVTIDADALAKRLGIPVVKTEAHRKKGLDAVRQAIEEAADRTPEGDPRRTDLKSVPQRPKLFPAEFYAACDRLGEKLAAGGNGELPYYLRERLILDVGGHVESNFAKHSSPNLRSDLARIRDELQQAGCRVPAVEARVRYAWARDVLQGVVTHPQQRPVTGSDKLDRILTHRFVGLGIFCVLMFVVFQAIYQWAGPFMEAIEAGQGRLGELVAGAVPPGAFRSLLVDGILAGVGGVIIFLPQIVFLFFFIALLEDCGYMARAAFLMDKLMTKVGLSGKSFVPLMSSFACAIPGVMATRVIENRRDRMVTILVAPLMSCSARLPVYLLLIAAFIPPTTYLKGWMMLDGLLPFLQIGALLSPEIYESGWISLHGLVLFGMSSLGVVVAVPVAWILKKTFFKGETPPFVMELPSYKWPSPRIVFERVYDRGKAFVMRAGTLIFATTIVVWAAGYFPAGHAELHRVEAEIESREAEMEGLEGTGDEAPTSAEETFALLKAEQNRLSGDLIARSFLGQAGHAIEPVVRPLGWDWRIGIGVIASFPAREVIIATLGTIYSLGGEVDQEDEGLIGSLHASTWPDGRKVYNVPVALSIMVFFALCAQCASTLMVIKRETNSWFWPAFTFAYMTTLAYIAAFGTYQLGMLLVG